MTVSITGPATIPGTSLVGIGLLVTESFEYPQMDKIISRLTNALGTPPKGDVQASESVLFGKSYFTPHRLRWTPSTERMIQLFRAAAKNTEFTIGDSLPLYQDFTLSVVDAPSLPYFLVVLESRVKTNNLDPSKINDALRSASLPPRLFVETLNGLSAQVSTVTPRVPYACWLTIRVTQNTLPRLAEQASQVRMRENSSFLETGLSKLTDDLRKEIPFRPEDPSGPLSYLVMTPYLHVILGQVENPFFGGLRTPFLMFLSDDETILSISERDRPHSASTLDVLPQAGPFFPMFGEAIIVELVGLSLWANQRLLSAQKLDREALALGNMPFVEKKASELVKALSDASVLGAKVAVALKEVSNIERRTSEVLDHLRLGNYPAGPEIILSPGKESPRREGPITSLSRVIRESLTLARTTLLDVEREIFSLQRHASDLATIRSTQASLKLGRDIRILTYTLVGLTAVIVLLNVGPPIASWIASILK